MSKHRDHRQAGYAPHDDAPWSWGNLLGSLVIVAAVVGLYAMASAADQHDAAKLQAHMQAERDRLAMPAKTLQAYERGMADAMEAVRGTPNGVALAQACMHVQR